MEVDNPWMIAFIIIVIVSMMCTPVVIWHMYYHAPFAELKYSLLFVLHITLYLEEISTLPYAWSSVDVLCDVMGWLHFYSGFANVLVVTQMGFHYLSYLISHYPTQINSWIQKYGTYVTFGLPLITLLPFSTNSYGVSNEVWCTLPSGSLVANNWAIIVFYAWIWLCLFLNTGQLTIALFRLSQQTGVEQVRNNIFSSIGLYIAITTLCWLPRAIPRLIHLFMDYKTSDILYLLTTVPLYLSGLGYAICYYIDVQSNQGKERRASSVHSAGSSLNADKIADILGGVESESSSFENPLYRGGRGGSTGNRSSNEFARQMSPNSVSSMGGRAVRKDSGVTDNM